MQQQDLIPHLFRTEYRKIAAVLSKWLGIENLQVAEDLTSETFLAALENWSYQGIPANPVAWLYTVAKNKTKNYMARSQLFKQKIEKQIRVNQEHSVVDEIDLSEQNIFDSQLQMLFAICHPAIPTESQVGLALRILCGFGIEEIANAFLTNKENISKRLQRAREKLRQENVKIEFPGKTEIENRLSNVLTTIYLLFNEGYYSETNDDVLREDLCFEAMRLTNLLLNFEKTNLPSVNALLSLMCFHASRFEARRNDKGELVLYEDQDETKWDQELISKGVYHLKEAAVGEQISRYHIEAGIAYWHTIKADSPEKWESVLHLYNQLLSLEYSPVAALNRTFALSKVRGKESAIDEAEKLKLTQNPFYFTLLGELYTGLNNKKAREYFESALAITVSQLGQQTIRKKIEKLDGGLNASP